MKTVYVVGASDCTPDPSFPGQCWVEIVESRLPNHIRLKNLAFPAASNFCVRLQIDQAIEQQADALIINFTSSVRTEILANDQKNHTDLLERFVHQELISLSRIQAGSISALDKLSQHELINYQIKFFDLDTAIQKNFYLIKGALLELKLQNRTNFCYSLGGFEHPEYSSNASNTYHEKLKEFMPWQSKQNLWDYFSDWRAKTHNIVRPRLSGPSFHISDSKINNAIADYYLNWISRHVN
jgi:hypothetical protein